MSPGLVPDVVCAEMLTYRIRLSKEEPLRFISHLDFTRAVIRALHRAEIPLKYSQGFNPRPRVSFGPPLPLGLTSRAEYADVHLQKPMRQSLFCFKLQEALPPDMRLLEAYLAFPSRQGSIMESIAELQYQVFSPSLPQKIKERLEKEGLQSLLPQMKEPLLALELESGEKLLMKTKPEGNPLILLKELLDLDEQQAKTILIERADVKWKNHA